MLPAFPLLTPGTASNSPSLVSGWRYVLSGFYTPLTRNVTSRTSEQSILTQSQASGRSIVGERCSDCNPSDHDHPPKVTPAYSGHQDGGECESRNIRVRPAWHTITRTGEAIGGGEDRDRKGLVEVHSGSLSHERFFSGRMERRNLRAFGVLRSKHQ